MSTLKFQSTYKATHPFSNFYQSEVTFEGLTYSTAEAAFQSAKTLDKEQRTLFTTLSASESKKAGRKVNLRPDWEEVKYDIMVNILHSKFKGDLLKRLLDTKDQHIIENTTGWHDNIWGNCECPKCINKEGKNLLGKALMQVREEKRKLFKSEEELFRTIM